MRQTEGFIQSRVAGAAERILEKVSRMKYCPVKSDMKSEDIITDIETLLKSFSFDRKEGGEKLVDLLTETNSQSFLRGS